MSIAEKLVTIAENEQKVYEAGKQDGVQSAYDRFWDDYQLNGKRTNYAYAFTREGWSDVTFRPKYDIKPTGTLAHLMTSSRMTDVVAILNECGVTIDTSGVTGTANQWVSGSATRLPAFSFVNVGELLNTFGWTYNLHTIEKVILREDGTNTFTNPFVSCDSLTNLTIEGKIGQNGFSVQWSNNLTHDSLMSIINALQDKNSVGGTWTVTLGTKNLAKLTDAEKAIATERGWTLA